MHAWERRYKTILPARSETGRRSYSAEDVTRLILLKACIDLGYRIGKIADLHTSELQMMIAKQEAIDRLEPLLCAIDMLDHHELDRILNGQYLTLGPIAFSKQVVMPLMHEVGQRWASGALSIAAEHMVSASVRTLLGHGMKMLPPGNRSDHILFTTPEGELHEIGALIAALIAQGQGLRTHYLGPQLPIKQIMLAVEKTNANIVCLSSLIARSHKGRPDILQLRQSLPEATELWLGGPGYSKIGEIQGLRYFECMEDFEHALFEITSKSGAVSRDANSLPNS
ncbi:methanogenic corrinoid protein MtbC1 [Agrobacterium vitis]|nr:methanogenic corrinoid protein MtbC1 [Agrobacterium vitis]MBE1437702.1 methanogenic corrinoid protein MtbC1 [Agrobacterium vitis]